MQSFHFLLESILVFFIFDQKRHKIAVLNFRFFIKKNLKTYRAEVKTQYEIFFRQTLHDTAGSLQTLRMSNSNCDMPLRIQAHKNCFLYLKEYYYEN